MSTFVTSRTDVSQRSSPRSGSFLLRVIGTFELILEKRRSRLALMEMSDDQLKDIGISRSQAFREASRPFWE